MAKNGGYELVLCRENASPLAILLAPFSLFLLAFIHAPHGSRLLSLCANRSSTVRSSLPSRSETAAHSPPFPALLIAITRRISRIQTDFCCVKKFYSPLETLATREPNSMEACLPFHKIRVNSITIGTRKPGLQLLESALRGFRYCVQLYEIGCAN